MTSRALRLRQFNIIAETNFYTDALNHIQKRKKKLIFDLISSKIITILIFTIFDKIIPLILKPTKNNFNLFTDLENLLNIHKLSVKVA